ncbi:MAG: hypothetical protein KC503_30825 [Myxococcales bacterium]|nr:hypothetical protein [Myxococcales bacterium]
MKKLQLHLFALIAALMLVLGGMASCTKAGPKADPKAAEACKTSAKKADACKACCKAAGMSGHMWMMGKGCSCL